MIIILGLLFNRKIKKEDIQPSVAFMIAAYNEEKDIKVKLENTLNLDYPKEKFNIIVVSDGSTDKTDDIVKTFENQGVKLYRVEGRVGKTEARNRAVLDNRQEIVIFSDATTNYKKDAVKKLVRNFADPSVGQVSGRLIYINENEATIGRAEKIYWMYENLIKISQTRFGTLTGATGCINAFRREYYTVLAPNIIEDLVEPLMFIMKGWRVVFEHEAIAFENAVEDVKEELGMRIRVIRGGMTGLICAKNILNPFKYPKASFQLISHKVLRWLVPFFATVAFLSSGLLLLYPGNRIYLILFLLQAVFYILAILGIILERYNIRIKAMAIPSYFLIVNYTSVIALFKTILSKLEPTWETNR